jgi:hypothetical protein
MGTSVAFGINVNSTELGKLKVAIIYSCLDIACVSKACPKV